MIREIIGINWSENPVRVGPGGSDILGGIRFQPLRELSLSNPQIGFLKMDGFVEVRIWDEGVTIYTCLVRSDEFDETALRLVTAEEA